MVNDIEYVHFRFYFFPFCRVLELSLLQTLDCDEVHRQLVLRQDYAAESPFAYFAASPIKTLHSRQGIVVRLEVVVDIGDQLLFLSQQRVCLCLSQVVDI